MQQIVKNLTLSQWVKEVIPSFSIALIMAEMLYKFHSFTLECLAFLVTWYGLAWLAEKINTLFSKPK